MRKICLSLFGLLLVGIAYVVAFSPSDEAFAQIKIGDSREHVVSLMGKPQHIEYRAPWIKGADVEYQYFVWPIPVVWAVAFKNERVFKKADLQSP